jgi:hypothetical protein
MIVVSSYSRSLLRAAAALALLGLLLGGCAGMGDNLTEAFADPAQFDLYDCKQLETSRKTLSIRAADLQGLMAKAQTGAGGSVVAELAYRNEYIAVRGQSRFAEEAWQRNKCQNAAPAAPVAPTPPVIAPAPSAPGARAKR